MATDPSLKATGREWASLAVLTLPVLLISMDMTVLYFALPFLSADLEPSSTQLLWIMDIYSFLLAGLLITMGTLGDRIGRRKLLMLGAAAFGAASAAAAMANSAEMLIVARALLGIGGATLMPSTLSLIRNMFRDDQQRRTAISVWTAALAGGAALGPLLGGALLEHFWWGSAFLVNVPVMVLLLILGPLMLPEFRDPNPGKFDLMSTALILAAILPVIYGMKKIAEDGVAVGPLATMAVGLLVGVVFVLRQRKLTHPLLDVSLFRNRAFSTSVTTNVLAMFAMVGFGLFTSQYLQLVYGLRPWSAGLWTLPAAGATMVSATLAAVLVQKIRPAYVISAGLLVAAAGFGVLAQVQADSELALVITGATMMAAGVGVVLTLAADLIIAAAPPERAGSASGLSETCAEFGGALGIAILGSIGTAVYSQAMDTDMPSGIPEAARDVAHETLGGAVQVAGQLPGDLAGLLLTSSREAFTEGMQVASYAAGGVMLLAAVLAGLMLRNLRISDPAAGDPHAAAPSSKEQDAQVYTP
ncbi:MFS transporter [Streptomyces parvus]|uniref:MFS transporter n=1 Tax=Streptomyces TaxID=1883 RepID=UPI00067A91C6|nr:MULTISPECIES: MFS transporter [unclassified Streptomyces]MYX02790.1 MFS transporter [Streptomyces sp. SID8378]PVC97803.1 MFS transporter [Streptomyces sp. CS147]SNB72294.1 MFS transporter, DHA2 family, multidrug resistance protein [Streptomyces sp. PgraA7]